MFGVFRAKNHDFTPKKSYFFPIAKVGANIFGVFRVKNHDFTQNNYIFALSEDRTHNLSGYKH
jgi:hypothetical protein